MLKLLFHALIVRPVVLIVLGLNVRHKARLPETGPAIIAANHNSHLDTLVLMSLFPLTTLPKLRPVAAADYFMRNKLMAWFSTSVLGIIPLNRHKSGSRKEDLLADCYKALEDGDIIIVFPEGSRGEPEKMTALKCGIAHLSKKFPDVPVVPVFLHGLGKALPKGEIHLVPLLCDVFVGTALFWQSSKSKFMDALSQSFENLSHDHPLPAWT